MSRLERWVVLVSTAVVAASGVGFFWTKYLLRPAPDAFSIVNHPLEPWFLKIHVLAAPAFVFAAGLLAVGHIARHLQLGVRLGRASGISALVTLGPMTATGYLLQVVTSPGWIVVLAWVHIGSGFAFLAALAAHTVVARRAARACVDTMRRIAEAVARREPDGEIETSAARTRTVRVQAVGGANPGTPDEAR